MRGCAVRRMVGFVAALGLVVGGGIVGSTPRAAHAATGLPALVVGEVGVAEGDSGTAVIEVPVDLSFPVATTVTVKYQLVSGSATAGSDFAAKSGKLTFLAGVSAKMIPIKIYGDTTIEGDESFTLQLNTPIGATIADGIGAITIHDDDGAVSGVEVAIGDATVTESDAGTHYVYLPITLSVPATQVVKVYVYFDCGDADPSSDYVPLPNRTLTFQLGQRSKTLRFVVKADQTPEDVKQFFEGMTVKVGSVTATAPVGSVTIVDNDHYGTQPVGAIDRVSVANDGTEASFWDPVGCHYALGSGVSSISRDGRFVTFWSAATNLVPGDDNSAVDMFLRDRLNDTTERIDGAEDGSELSAGSEPYAPISDDGRYAAFSTSSPEVQPSGVTFSAFRRDRVTGANQMVSISPTGVPVSGVVSGMTGDGRYVAFASSGAYYVRDVVAGTTRFVTAGTGGWNRTPLSSDGQQIAFVSSDSTLVANDTNNYPDVFVKNLVTDVIERVNVTTSGQQDSTPPWSGAQPLNASRLAMSPDGRYVAFWSGSANLVTSGTTGVFLHDRATGVTEQESVGVVTSMTNCFAQDESVSDDGEYVSFSYHCEQSDTINRTSDVNGAFLHDRTNNATVRVDELPDGTAADSDGWSSEPTSVMSGDGRYVAFQSDATNLVPNDTNDHLDVFAKRVN